MNIRTMNRNEREALGLVCVTIGMGTMISSVAIAYFPAALLLIASSVLLQIAGVFALPGRQLGEE